MISSAVLTYTISAILIVHTSQFVFLKVDKDGSCPPTPQPLNNSIISAWETTKKIEEWVMRTYGTKGDICAELITQLTNKERGMELLKTMETIKCYARGGDFAKTDMKLVSHAIMAISEIVVHPEVCLDDDDIDIMPCSKMDTSDFVALHRTVIKQRFLLEGLLMGTYF